MTPTDEQAHILSRAKGTANLSISALAGCGKTSTLEMFEAELPSCPVLYLVFNKKNAKEAEGRMRSTTTVKTLNGLGHTVWARTVGKNLAVDPKKNQKLLSAIIQETPKNARDEISDCFWEILHGVAMAKAMGYIPDGKYPQIPRIISQAEFHKTLEEQPDDLVSDLIDAVLFRSITAAYAGSIDFDDQVYMSGMFGGTYPKFPIILVDEAQDLSPVNHAMLEKLAHGRIIAVGDPWQSIYQFRGAAANGFNRIKDRYSAEPCDLSISFRCPSEIVRNVHWRVPHFKWLREGGYVEKPKYLDLSAFTPNSTIICRNNAPLLSCALRLLSHGISVRVVGSEIGPKLIGIMRKLGPESLDSASLLAIIADWKAEKLSKNSATAEDMAACMSIFASAASNLAGAIAYASHIFAQDGTIQLMTGHKSKGLEFDNVFFLEPNLVRRPDRDEQEMNLDYVISTRSKDRLTEIALEGIRW